MLDTSRGGDAGTVLGQFAYFGEITDWAAATDEYELTEKYCSGFTAGQPNWTTVTGGRVKDCFNLKEAWLTAAKRPYIPWSGNNVVCRVFSIYDGTGGTANYFIDEAVPYVA
jgi:hypothetical protein